MGKIEYTTVIMVMTMTAMTMTMIKGHSVIKRTIHHKISNDFGLAAV